MEKRLTKKGYSRPTISHNIEVLRHAGIKESEAVAVSLSVARETFRERNPGKKLPEYLRGPYRHEAKKEPRRRNPVKKSAARKKNPVRPLQKKWHRYVVYVIVNRRTFYLTGNTKGRQLEMVDDLDQAALYVKKPNVRRLIPDRSRKAGVHRVHMENARVKIDR